MDQTKISIVSPVYMAEKIVDKLVSEIIENIDHISNNYEIILVNDGSPDKSWEKINEICKFNKNVVGLKLSRNFGQHHAIMAGINHAQGDWIVVMDCDLQDRPDQLKKMFSIVSHNNKVVLARRKSRKDNSFRKLASIFFYKIFSYLTQTKQDSSIANFGIYHKSVIASIISMGDSAPYFPAMVQWVGFDKVEIDIEHGEREVGKSSYSLLSLIRLMIDIIISFSDKPLRLIIKFGFTLSLLSSIVGLYYLMKYLNGSIVVSGFTSLIISIWFLSGIIIFVLGWIGLYLSRVFEKVKDRPRYIINEKLNYN